MTVQDFDWAGGAKLIDYQIIDDGQAKKTPICRVQVKLNLKQPGKGQGEGRREEGVVPRRDQSFRDRLPRHAAEMTGHRRNGMGGWSSPQRPASPRVKKSRSDAPEPISNRGVTRTDELKAR